MSKHDSHVGRGTAAAPAPAAGKGRPVIWLLLLVSFAVLGTGVTAALVHRTYDQLARPTVVTWAGDDRSWKTLRRSPAHGQLPRRLSCLGRGGRWHEMRREEAPATTCVLDISSYRVLRVGVTRASPATEIYFSLRAASEPVPLLTAYVLPAEGTSGAAWYSAGPLMPEGGRVVLLARCAGACNRGTTSVLLQGVGRAATR